MLDTSTTMKPEVTEALQELVAVNSDSAQGFEQAAALVEDELLKRMFHDLSADRRSFAADLSCHVTWNGEEVETGTFRGRMHRWWMRFRSLVEHGNSQVILDEAERGEDHIKERYAAVIADTPESAATSMLRSQYAAVCRSHDRIKSLRDGALKPPVADLEPRIITALQELAAVNNDSAKGLTQAAELVKDERLARLFRRLGNERRIFASDLSRHVTWSGEDVKSGTFRGLMHRWWTEFRGLLERGDPRAILEEAERGEDRIKGHYASVLGEIPGDTPLGPLLREQYESVCRAHANIKQLRDETPVY